MWEDISGAHGVDELCLGYGVEQHCAKVGHFHPHRIGVEGRAHRILHPAIGDENPQRGEIGPNRDHEGHRQMPQFRQTIPAKEHQSDEGCFKEEGHQSFDRERRAENVADIMREIRPVSAEFELHGQSGSDAENEVDPEDLSPEPRDFAPDRAARHHIDRFHDDEHEAHAERQRHEQKMIQGG